MAKPAAKPAKPSKRADPAVVAAQLKQAIAGALGGPVPVATSVLAKHLPKAKA